MEGLNFEPCPVVAKGKDAPAAIKVSALRTGNIRVSLNAAAFAKFGRPEALRVATATNDKGRHFLMLRAAPKGEGWPVTDRSHVGKGQLPATCLIETHPFEIGVVHKGHDVETTWADDHAIVALPNWERMLDEIEASEGGDAEDEG